MARVLILGGAGGRGLALAERIVADGHLCRIAVQGDTEQRAAGQAAGVEPWAGDPGRLGTVIGALEGVAVVCWLLGEADRPPAELAQLHGPRLEAFLRRVVDTGVRGLLYEAAGSTPAGLLREGARMAGAIAARNAIPLRVIDVPPAERERWRQATHSAVSELLEGG